MGLIRLLNPLVLNPTAPRHRQARALEAIQRDTREALAEARAAVEPTTYYATATPVEHVEAPAVEGWSAEHAAAIMAAFRAGDRAGVELAIAEAYASIGQVAPA